MTSTEKNTLVSCIEELQSSNGAGFVLEKEGCFYLIASAYESINDAELVKNNLKQSSVEAEILTFEKEKIMIEGNFNLQEKEILQDTLKCNLNLFKRLYDVAISLDTGVVDKNKAKVECNNIYSSFIATKTNFESFFKDENLSDDLLQIKNNLQNINNSLSTLASENYQTSSQTFSSLIKQTYCKILFE